MDTFTVMTGAFTIALIYFGEKFESGSYLLIATIFSILFAWRMGEEVFYMGTAALIFTLVYRAFFAEEDIRDPQKEIDNDA